MSDGPLLWITPLLVALGASYVGVAIVRRWLMRHEVLDHPGHRSSHLSPTPRGGGLGIVAGFLAGLSVSLALAGTLDGDVWRGDGVALLALVGGGGVVALVGWLDDLRSQPVWLRLACQALAAGLLVAGVGSIDALRLPVLGELRLGTLGPPLTVLGVVAVTNMYNFMDGIDGLAAGQASIAGLWLMSAALFTGHAPVAVASACLAAAALGFLAHNFPPARVFMGDVGSTFLGFTFAGLAVLGAQPGASRISVYVSALLLAPFLFDATFTLALRVWRGERLHEAHSSHLYQRLVRAGYSHRRVSLLYYLLALLLGGLGMAEVVTGQGATELFFVLAVVPLALLVAWIRRVEGHDRAERAGMAGS